MVPVASAGIVYISIHAPQWGATWTRWLWFRSGWYFNPRTPVGCDTLHMCEWYEQGNFNPRTPVGCDDAGLAVLDGDGISIHAPQWGATNRISSGRTRWYFNQRTPVGCDLLFLISVPLK